MNILMRGGKAQAQVILLSLGGVGCWLLGPVHLLFGEPGSDGLDKALAVGEGLGGIHEFRPCDSGHTLISCINGCEGFLGC